MRRLKELDKSILGRLLIWPAVEIMKTLIAQFPMLSFDEAARGTSNKKYKVGISTILLGRGLVKFFKKNPFYQKIPVVSSHYAAIAAGKKTGLKKLLIIGPDFFPHPQTAIPDVVITSPGKVFTDELLKLGVKKENIREIGVILTPKAEENAKKYIEVRKKVALTKKNPMHILITMGGAGPETNEVIETVQKLKELILAGHQLCSISVVVGDNRPDRVRLRKKLMNIIQNQILEDTKGRGFRVFGGKKGFTKKDEVKKTWELVASSIETNGLPPVDLMFTRPNDMSLISTAMGIPTILYKACGSHEKKAEHYLTNSAKFSIPFQRWKKIKQTGEIIDLGNPLEAAFIMKSRGLIKSDSGGNLIEVINELCTDLK